MTNKPSPIIKTMSRRLSSGPLRLSSETRFTLPNQDFSKSKLEQILDKTGIWLSGLCMVHCILTPIVLILLPMMTFAKSEWVHLVLAGVLPIIAFGAFIPGVRRHKDWAVIKIGLVGLALIIFAALDPFHWLNEITEGAVTSVGSLSLILAHLRNRRNVHCVDPSHSH
jgi:hypothetical protein